jgi:hypothetical protein
VAYTYSSENTIYSLSTTGNGVQAISTTIGGGANYIRQASLAEGLKSAHATNYANSFVYIDIISGFVGDWTYGGNIVSQNATAGGTGIEWKMNVTDVLRASNYPLKLRVAEFAALTTAQVTITLYFKKSSTDIAAKFVLPGGQIGGPVADTVTPCPDDANRNQLTLQFNPTAAGVFYVEAWAWWAANLADESVIIDDISITQA